MPRSVAELLAHADELADSFGNFEPIPGAAHTTGLGELYLAVQDRAGSERRLQKAVDASREEGTSWGLIGRMLGTTGEAARQRFSSTVPVKKANPKKAAKAAPAKKATKAVPAKKATTKTAKAVPVKRVTKKSSGYGLAASSNRQQPTGKTTSRVSGTAQHGAR